MLKKSNYIILLFLLVGLFSSCSITNYLKKGYSNFTTYFNIYYNASRLFAEAENEILLQQKEIFTTRVIAPGGNVTNKLIQVIEKCSKILQYHSESSLIDDALFLIGKSYYYQREFPSAIRKFNELITNFPESPYFIESKLWIARSYAQTIEVDRALNLLNDLIIESREKKKRKILSETLLEILKINFVRNDYESIISFGNEFVKTSKDKNQIAQVYLLMGTAYAKLGQLDEAINNYRKVEKYTSDYYYRFKSKLELAKILREQGNYDEAQNILNPLYRESIYDEYKDYIELEFAYFYLSQQDTLKALEHFIKIDTTYSNKPTAGIAQFEIANYLENNLGNLDSAKFYYNKSLRTQLPDDIKKVAQFKSKLLENYKTIWTSINNLSKQIPVLRTFPVDSTFQKFQEIEIDSSMLGDSTYLAEVQEYLEEKRKADSLYAIKLKQDSLRYEANLKTADSLEVNVARLRFDLATLFMIDYNKPDSAYYHLKEIVEKFPDKDFSERAIYALANYYLEKGEKHKADSLYRFIYDNFTDSEISKIVAKYIGLEQRITKSDLPDIEYRKIEKLIDQEKYNEAIQQAYTFYENYQKTDYAPKILLLIGFVYEEKLRMYDSAYSVYKSLREKYPSSLFAQRINSKLIAYESELQKKELEKKAIQDSLDLLKQSVKKEEELKLLPEEEKLKEEKFQKVEQHPETKPDSNLIRERHRVPEIRK